MDKVIFLVLVLIASCSPRKQTHSIVDKHIVTSEMASAFELFQVERNILASQDYEKYQSYVEVCSSQDSDDAVKAELSNALYDEAIKWLALNETCNAEGNKLLSQSPKEHQSRIKKSIVGCSLTCKELLMKARRSSWICLEFIRDDNIKNQIIEYR